MRYEGLSNCACVKSNDPDRNVDAKTDMFTSVWESVDPARLRMASDFRSKNVLLRQSFRIILRCYSQRHVFFLQQNSWKMCEFFTSCAVVNDNKIAANHVRLEVGNVLARKIEACQFVQCAIFERSCWCRRVLTISGYPWREWEILQDLEWRWLATQANAKRCLWTKAPDTEPWRGKTEREVLEAQRTMMTVMPPLLRMRMDAKTSGHPKESIMETFARRWRNADKEFGSDKICTRVWEEHELLGYLGDGQFARTYKVRQKSTGKVLALKLCSTRRLGRGLSIPFESAALDHKHEANPAVHFLAEEIAENVRELRLERTLLRCLTGLCPFVMEIATDCGFSSIFDDLEGELGYPMSAGFGSLRHIWDMSWLHCQTQRERTSQKRSTGSCHFLGSANGGGVALSSPVQHNLFRFRYPQLCHGPWLVHSTDRLWKELRRRQSRIAQLDVQTSTVDRCGSTRAGKTKNGIVWRRLTFAPNLWWASFAVLGSWKRHMENEPSDKEMVQLEKLYEIFKLGKTLFSLQWPCDFKFCSVLNKMLLPRDIEKYRCDNPSPPTAIISGDLLDFVNHLIADHTQPGVGFTNSDDLIRHRVFRDINFDELRLPSGYSVHHVFTRWWTTSWILMVPLLVTPPRSEKEKEYCGKLSEEQKQVFRSNYFEWERKNAVKTPSFKC